MERSIVFISHATHEDDFFAVWLAAKLRNIGYEVWVDVDDLRAGDSFFTVLKPIIDERAIRFIPLNTKKYIEKAKDQQSGVSRELNCASQVKGVNNFIVPVRFDEVSFAEFPMHYNGWNTVDFHGDWQKGLVGLVNELEKGDVPKTGEITDSINDWFKSLRGNKKVVEKAETYFSNWFPMKLPSKVYVHQPFTVDKESLYKIPFPFVVEGNRIISFFDQSVMDKYLRCTKTDNPEIERFLSSDTLQIDSAFNLIEPRKKLVRLLNNSFESHLRRNGLIYFRRQEKKRPIFYFRLVTEGSKSIDLSKYGMNRRWLAGSISVPIERRLEKVHWHFAIKATAVLYPEAHFEIFYTLVFTDERFKRLNKEYQMRLRRTYPTSWYNRRWFETLLAAMLSISASSTSEHLEINVGETEIVEVSNLPYSGTSRFGYIEPGIDHEN